MFWKRRRWLRSVVLAAGLLLAACGPWATSTVEKTLWVGPSQIECEDAAPRQCLLVRESEEQDWVQTAGQIEGFDYEAGFEYELRILEERSGRAADGATVPQRTLLEVVNKARRLEGTIWVLTEYVNSSGEDAPALEGNPATVRFLHGDLGGNGSCNSYFGSYELGPEWLEIIPGGMTEMYCSPEEVMVQEREFLALLPRADIYLLEEDRLRILDEDWKLMLTFEPMGHASLVGTPWQLEGYSDGSGAFVSLLAGTEVTASFGEDGQLVGSAGCNSYSGSYEISGSDLTLGQVSNTEMACMGPDGIMEQEVAFLSAMRTVTSYQVEGNTLTLLNEQGVAALTFGLAAPADEP